MRRAAALLVLLVVLGAPRGPLAPSPALAREELTNGGLPTATASRATVQIRTGDHPGYGRIVFDLPAGVTHAVTPSADGIMVRFSGQAGALFDLAAAPRVPRNVQGISVLADRVAISMQSGAQLRPSRIGDRIILDVVDPSTAPDAPTVQARPTPASVARPAPPADQATGRAANLADPVRRQSPDARYRAYEQGREVPAADDAKPPNATAAPTLVSSAPVSPVTAEPARAAEFGVAVTLSPETAVAPRSIILPFGPLVGAAALRRDDTALIVFDERRPVDMARLRDDPVFAAASVQVLPAATLIRMPLEPDQQLRLLRVDGGWTVSVLPSDGAQTPLRPIAGEMVEGRLRIHADAPGRVVSVPDPVSGTALLVGTQRNHGQAMAIDRRTPEFALLATWQGVVVVPLTDAMTMRPSSGGFVLAADAERSLAVSAPESQTQALTSAARASRHYDLPALPAVALHRRLQAAILAAASAAPQARTARRRDVAEAMLALGMGAEMQAVLALTVADDARAGEDAGIVGLAAIAAMLAGRHDEAAGIDDPRLTGTDEIALWRAVRAAQRDEGSARAAAVFASALPLVLAYPAELRERLLPRALETMVLGGEHAKASALLEKMSDAPSLDLARAIAVERAGGDPAAALEIFDRVAASPDRRARARAARMAVEMRLANGLTTIPEAANALERLSFSWRGDQQEIDLRGRVAELRAQTGSWRAAIGLLREARALFPAEDAVLRKKLSEVFTRSLASDAEHPLSPIELVTLVEENADLIPEGDAGHLLAGRLAERLTALDLPQRAVVILEKLVADVPPGPARAAFGGRLAALRLQQGDPGAALAALSASVAEGALPIALLEARTLTFAQAAATTGDLATAVDALRDLATPPAHELRATLLEAAHDWRGAAGALSDFIAMTLPATGPLEPPQARLVLRLATAASHAGDEPGLARLRAQHASRFPEGQLRDLFQLIAATPVAGVADLPRAAREMQLARGAPDSMRAVAPSR